MFFRVKSKTKIEHQKSFKLLVIILKKNDDF